jgi:FKBP-type peptidyl-prolyl cis-trans isomerase
VADATWNAPITIEFINRPWMMTRTGNLEETMLKRVGALLIVGLLLIGCADKEKADKAKQGAEDKSKQETSMSSTMPNLDELTFVDGPEGLRYAITTEGEGEKIGNGVTAVVHYTGWLTDGRKFDSSKDRGEPFEFNVGARQVIRGWDLAVSDMKVGETRVIVLKPELAYGSRGAGNVIPPNATLVFEVEALDTK